MIRFLKNLICAYGEGYEYRRRWRTSGAVGAPRRPRLDPTLVRNRVRVRVGIGIRVRIGVRVIMRSHAGLFIRH